MKSLIAETEYCCQYDVFFTEKGDHLKKKCANGELIMDIYPERQLLGCYITGSELVLIISPSQYTLSDITSDEGSSFLNTFG